MSARIRHHRRGVTIEQHGCVLSELPRRPGPTNNIFDVLAAGLFLYSGGPRTALLGFAAGGLVAPLRYLGGEHEVHGVDLESEGYQLFGQLARDWCGEVKFTREDALSWLRAQRIRFDGIVEDLSTTLNEDVVKPPVSWQGLPGLLKRRVRAGGVVVSNLIPTPGLSVKEMIEVCQVGPDVLVEFEDFYNRVLIQGRGVGSARQVGKELRGALWEMESELVDGITVRSLPSGR